MCLTHGLIVSFVLLNIKLSIWIDTIACYQWSDTRVIQYIFISIIQIEIEDIILDITILCCFYLLESHKLCVRFRFHRILYRKQIYAESILYYIYFLEKRKLHWLLTTSAKEQRRSIASNLRLSNLSNTHI